MVSNSLFSYFQKSKVQHLNILAPSAKADGKEMIANRKAFLSYFYYILPSALADGAKIFECLNFGF